MISTCGKVLCCQMLYCVLKFVSSLLLFCSLCTNKVAVLLYMYTVRGVDDIIVRMSNYMYIHIACFGDGLRSEIMHSYS